MITFAVLPVSLALAAGTAPAPKFSSTYSDANQCEWNAMSEEAENNGSDGSQDCPVLAPYYIHEYYSAESTIRALHSRKDPEFRILLAPEAECPLPSHGARIEWRLANGVPFALIYRVACTASLADGGKRLGEYLLVRGLKDGFSADVDVKAAPKPNLRARALADSHWSATPSPRRP
jgi:hypothetical protein